MNTVMQTQNS